MSSPTRWAGVPLKDRRAERRALLVEAAYRLFGSGGEAAVSVRSVCRECGLNTRYFYESFGDTDDLLGAVYDRVSEQLAEVIAAAIEEAGDSLGARTRAGIAAVLGFSADGGAAACYSPMRAPTRCWPPAAAPPRTCCARGTDRGLASQPGFRSGGRRGRRGDVHRRDGRACPAVARRSFGQ